MVVAVGKSLQKRKRDEQQRDDEVDSVHHHKRKRPVTQPYPLSDFFLSKQAPQSLRLCGHKDDPDKKRLDHSPAKQPLPLTSYMQAGALQQQTSNDQHQRTHDKRQWENQSFRLRDECADPNQQPRSNGTRRQGSDRQQKETKRQITSSLKPLVERFFRRSCPLSHLLGS